MKCALLTATMVSALQMFIKIGTFNGSTQDKLLGPSKWSDVKSYSISMETPVDIGSGLPGRPNLSSFHFVKNVDTSSTAIETALTTGQLIPTVSFQIRAPVGANAPFAIREYEFKNVRIASYAVAHTDGDSSLVEQVTISYQSVRDTYYGVTPTGVKGSATTFTYSLVGSALA